MLADRLLLAFIFSSFLVLTLQQVDCSLNGDYSSNGTGKLIEQCTQQSDSSTFLLGTFQFPNYQLFSRSSVVYRCYNNTGHEIYNSEVLHLDSAGTVEININTNELEFLLGTTCTAGGCYSSDFDFFNFAETISCYLDKNECATMEYECHVNATCSNNETGTYYCECNEGFNGDGFQCDLNEAPVVHVTADSTEVSVGSDVSLYCKVTYGSPTSYTFTWIKLDNSSKYMNSTNETESLSILTLSNITMDDIASYTCVVSNTVGSGNNTISLEVGVPPSVTSRMYPNFPVALLNSTVMLVCEATSPASIPADFTWKGPSGIILSNESTINITITENGDYGDYVCVTSNAFGENNATITIEQPVPPSISLIGRNQSRYFQVSEGDDFSLSISVSDFNVPLLELSWIREGDGRVLSSEGDRVNISYNSTFPVTADSSVSSTLHFSSLQSNDSGSYYVIVSPVKCDIFYITIDVLAVPPFVLVPAISTLAGTLFILLVVMLFFAVSFHSIKRNRQRMSRKIRQGITLVGSEMTIAIPFNPNCKVMPHKCEDDVISRYESLLVPQNTVITITTTEDLLSRKAGVMETTDPSRGIVNITASSDYNPSQTVSQCNSFQTSGDYVTTEERSESTQSREIVDPSSPLELDITDIPSPFLPSLSNNEFILIMPHGEIVADSKPNEENCEDVLNGTDNLSLSASSLPSLSHCDSLQMTNSDIHCATIEDCQDVPLPHSTSLPSLNENSSLHQISNSVHCVKIEDCQHVLQPYSPSLHSLKQHDSLQMQNVPCIKIETPLPSLSQHFKSPLRYNCTNYISNK